MQNEGLLSDFYTLAPRRGSTDGTSYAYFNLAHRCSYTGPSPSLERVPYLPHKWTMRQRWYRCRVDAASFGQSIYDRVQDSTRSKHDPHRHSNALRKDHNVPMPKKSEVLNVGVFMENKKASFASS